MNRSIASARMSDVPAVTASTIAATATSCLLCTVPRRRASRRIAAAASQTPMAPVIAPERTIPSPPVMSAGTVQREPSGRPGPSAERDEPEPQSCP